MIDLSRHQAVLYCTLLLSCALVAPSPGFAQTPSEEAPALITTTVVVDGMMKAQSGATWLGWPEGVEAALDGLAGIERIEVDLARDAFTVTYRPGQLETEAILRAIRELGFSPKLAPPETAVGSGTELDIACSRLTDPLKEALATASAAGKLLFLDFFAEWCAPCHVLEEEILPHPRVTEALTGYEVFRIDADRDLEAVECLGVHGLPTIVVLGADGGIRYRRVGLPEIDELADELEQLTHSNQSDTNRRRQ